MGTKEIYGIQTDNSTIKINSSGQLYIASVPPVDISVTNPIANSGNTLSLNYDNATLNTSGSGSSLAINLANANTWTGEQTFNGNIVIPEDTDSVTGFQSGIFIDNGTANPAIINYSSLNAAMQIAASNSTTQSDNYVFIMPDGSFDDYIEIQGSANTVFASGRIQLYSYKSGLTIYNNQANLASATASVMQILVTSSLHAMQFYPTGKVITAKNTLDDGSGVQENNAAQTTLTGTTAGSIVWSEPFQGSAYKKFIGYASGYENTTATAQTITFPTAFADTPIITGNNTGMALTASTTTLTLPASMSATASGFIIIEGF